MTADVLELLGVALDILWIGLAIAIGVAMAAGIWAGVRLVGARLERRYLPRVARWSRRRTGVAQDAGPWACPICHSVNPATVARCYGCGVPRPTDAPELVEAAADPTIYHHAEPPNRFDPSLYRGPGVVVAPQDDPGAGMTLAADPAEGNAPSADPAAGNGPLEEARVEAATPTAAAG